MSDKNKPHLGEKLLFYRLSESNMDQLAARLVSFGYQIIQVDSLRKLEDIKDSDPARVAIIELDTEKANPDTAPIISTIRKVSKVMKIVGVFRGRLAYNPEPLIKNGIDIIYQIPFEEEVFINCVFEFAPVELENDHLTIESLSRVNVVELEWSDALPFDLFICLPHNRKILQYRQKGQPLDEKSLIKFRQHREYAIYIKKNELSAYYSYTAQILSRLKNDSRLSQIEKERKLSGQIQKLLGSMFSTPSENEREGQEVVENVRKVLTQMTSATSQDEPFSQMTMELAAQNMSNYTHCRNVATYCALFGLALGIQDHETLQMGGFLHDIGMSDVDPKLLLKPWSEMTELERNEIRVHTAMGVQSLRYKKMKVSEHVINMITQHHERHDGSGYPDRLKDDQIDIYAKICAFADEFDELTSLRFGQKTCTPVEAMKRIAGLDGNPPLPVYEDKIFRPLVISFLKEFDIEIPSTIAVPPHVREAVVVPIPVAEIKPVKVIENTESSRPSTVRLVESKVSSGKVSVIDKNEEKSPLFAQDSKPLFDAINEGDLNKIQKALQIGININIRGLHGMTPIMIAIMLKNREVVKALLRSKADINLQNESGKTPLMLAIESENFEVFNQLLIYAFENSFVPGAEQSSTGKTWASNVLDIGLKNNEGETALATAARVGNDQMFEALLDAGADIYVKNNAGQAVSEIASAYGHTSIVETITRYEAFVNKSADVFGEAAEESNEDASNLQNEVDVKARDKQGQTHLMIFAAMGNAEMVKKFINLKSEIDAKDFSGATALLLAIKKGSAKSVQMLLDAKANPNIKDGQGKNALIHAIEIGVADLIPPLIRAGAKIDGRFIGATPLMVAAHSGNLAVVRALIDHGAKVDDKDNKGKTAIDFAKAKNNLAVVDYLEGLISKKKVS